MQRKGISILHLHLYRLLSHFSVYYRNLVKLRGIRTLADNDFLKYRDKQRLYRLPISHLQQREQQLRSSSHSGSSG